MYREESEWRSREKGRISPEHERPIRTLDRPLIIESAFPGWLPPSVNPHIPIATDAVAREIVASVQAGAAAIHVHPRDPETGLLMMDPHALKGTLDPVFAACPDVFTANHTWIGDPGKPISYIEHTQESLRLGNGPRYVEGSVVLISGNPVDRVQPLYGDGQAVKEGVAWLEAHGVKPLFQIYDTKGIEWLQREIIEPGLATWKPFVCVLHMGKHDSTYADAAQDPWAFLQLMASLHAVRAAIPDAVVGLRPGGRNWLPLTVAAIIMGIDLVSVGVEDSLWMYPHRNEIITRNQDVIQKVATIAREVGRTIATPAQVRGMLQTEKIGALQSFSQR